MKSSSAELAKGTLYLHFKSKEELLYSILEPFLEEYKNGLAKLTNKKNEPADKTIKKAVQYAYNLYVREPEGYTVILRYKAKEYNILLSKKKFGRLRNLMKKNLQLFEAVFSRGLEQGIFHNVVPQVASIIFWNVLLGVIQFEENRLFTGGRSYLKPTLDTATDILLRGMKSRNTG